MLFICVLTAMRVCASSWKGENCRFLPRQERITGETVRGEGVRGSARAQGVLQGPGMRWGTPRAHACARVYLP